MEELIETRNIVNYFPRKMAFTDVNGNVYPEAYCVPVLETFNPLNKTANFAEYFFKSAEEFNQGQPPITERDGGVRRITYRGTEFDKFGLQNAAKIAEIAILIHAEFDRRLDTPDGAGAMVSFFEGAGSVIFPPQLKG